MAEKKLNPVKPKIGMIVRHEEYPGLWQVLDKSPKRGGFWLLAYDDEAKAVGKWSIEATSLEMKQK
ncbi:hypothetical protein AOZ07_02930 [Glutamicibacter halophytocola]|uniref:hypothetical protein n=1 Tax=Glutamicibacter halophytocola TaxID=1933880 RepID=UPI0006D4B2BC|nr:hypothetical protein [Glutamicibacter halophytocola]ALG28053.1 hypothetical protein AOZ07_02930 [Glutamicibacter halophytocola]